MSNTVINPYNFAVAAVGAWKEIARTTLGSAAVDIDVTGISDKMYYMYLIDAKFADTNPRDLRMQTGNGSFDTGTNYSDRISHDGGADGTNVTQTFATTLNSLGIAVPAFGVGYASNLASQEKLFQLGFVHQNTAGAGTAPSRNECVWKWANTSNPLDRLRVTRTSTYQFDTGSQVVVLGYDPTDTHTTVDNFWQELASVDLSGGAAGLIDSGTFTAKKYLWAQLYVSTTGGAVSQRLTFNADTGANYAQRFSNDGGADLTATGGVNIDAFNDDMVTDSGGFTNFFIINNSANEKLGIVQAVSGEAAGAANVPTRDEGVLKWDNTSSQITQLTFTDNKAGDMDTTTTLKVWGSD
jgi:hypothetical protein